MKKVFVLVFLVVVGLSSYSMRDGKTKGSHLKLGDTVIGCAYSGSDCEYTKGEP